MNKVLTFAVLASLAALPAQAQNRTRTPPANPSAVIAAEIAFARMAQEKGQWTAFRAHAAKDGVMFVPQMVLAQDWLKNRPDPARAVSWQPHIVWSSCDGSLVASYGAWQGQSGAGYFTTIWQRQKKGEYRWVLDHGDAMAFPLDAPAMIQANVADCPTREELRERTRLLRDRRKARPAPFDPAQRSGEADDGSLAWSVTVTPEGARTVSVNWRKDGAMGQALLQSVEAPPAAAPPQPAR